MTARSTPHLVRLFYFMAALTTSLVFIMVTVASSQDNTDLKEYNSINDIIYAAETTLERTVNKSEKRILIDTIEKQLKILKSFFDKTKNKELKAAGPILIKRIEQSLVKQKVLARDTVELSGEKTEIEESETPSTKTTFRNPPISFPWKIENWPENTRAMPSVDLLTKIKVLEQSPSKWAELETRAFKRMKSPAMKEYLVSHIKAMYVRIEKKPWNQILAEQTRIGAYYPGYFLNRDVQKFSKGWSKGSFKKEMLDSVFGVNIFDDKIIDYKWNWINSIGTIETVQSEFEQGQKKLRNVLLQVDDKWDPQTTRKWSVEINKYRDEIINSERKMIWLLGASDKNVGKWLDNAVKFKNKELVKAHKELLSAFADKYWFTKTGQFALATPPGMDPSHLLAGKDDVSSHKEIDTYAKAIENYYIKLLLGMEAVGDVMDKIGGKKKIYTAGIKRAIELKLFRPHLIDRKAIFYKSILGDIEYKKMKDSFSVLTSGIVYREFLSSDEFTKYEEQQEIRLGNRQ